MPAGRRRNLTTPSLVSRWRSAHSTAPALLFNASGELIAFAMLSIIVFGPTKFLMKKHCDGTKEGVEYSSISCRASLMR